MSAPPAVFAAYAARDAEWARLLAILADECSNQALLLPLLRDSLERVEWTGRVQAALVSSSCPGCPLFLPHVLLDGRRGFSCEPP